VSNLNSPLNSLKQGHWFKLICGASYQHLPSVRNLTLAYALAGADCIDVAADPAVIASAKAALQVAEQIEAQVVAPGIFPNAEDISNFYPRNQRPGKYFGRTPLLMVSLNDGEDPHFRKAEFDPAVCPPNCPRPCEKICPAEAIAFPKSPAINEFSPATNYPSPSESPIFSGVIDAKCYGCGRCVPVCPLGLIQTRSYVSTPQAVAELVLPCGVDAVEIHTQVGRLEDFKRLWSAIAPWVYGQGNRPPLKLIAISCPDGENLIDYLWSIYQVISPLPCALVWQTDGRPMSGDIGAGTTHASIKLGQKVLRAGLPGYVQLAGGTNHHTVSKLRSANLLKSSHPGNHTEPKDQATEQPTIAGIAYGSYARVLLSPLLDRLEQLSSQEIQSNIYLENYPNLLVEAINLANSLVSQIKMGLELQCSTHNTKP
jgi:Fe-S-cluster-containing hydrogenase component 2